MSTNWPVIIWAGLLISINWKNTTYDLIFLIVGLYDELVQILIDVSGLAEVFIPPNLFINNQDLLSTFKS